MNLGILIRVLFGIAFLSGFLYVYIAKQNTITELRLHIPVAAKKLEEVFQENTQLRFEIDKFENPQHLMQLSREAQFSHLKHPLLHEIVTIRVP